jgi:KaiC/GvpD/RAD55 family RecA-like ATPase
MMASVTNVGLLADLLDTILQENRELLLELNISNVISGFRKENPVVYDFEVGADLHVNASRLVDEADVLMTLGSLVFTIKEYIEIFVGKQESETRVGTAVMNFRNRTNETHLVKLKEMMPEIFAIGSVSPEASLESLDDLEKVKRIYLHLLTRASTESTENIVPKIVSQLKQKKCIKSISDDLVYMEFSGDASMDDAVAQLSDVVEKVGLHPKIVEQILGEYGRIPADLRILSRLFGGALSENTKFGCPPIDALLRNGIGRDDTILLEGPTGVEKEVLSGMFLKEGLDKKGCAIIVSTGCSIHTVRKKLESSGTDWAAAEAQGRLIFVDWYSRHTERITSIEATGGLIKVSNDLTNLAVGIDMALRKASAHSQTRLVMDIVSPTTITEGFDRVHDFLNSVRAKMKNAGCTGLVLINQAIHPPDELGMLEDIFDGTMCIERVVEHGKIQSSIRIASYSGGAFSSTRLSMSVTGRGLEISGMEHGTPPEIIPFDHDDEKAIMGLPGIESLSANGLPVGSSFLVWMPSSMMPADYVKPVVMEAQKEGHAILLVLSSVNSENLGEWMSENGLSRKGLIDRGLLQIVDWYGQKSAKVLGMEIDEGIVRTSKDLTHMGVGIDFSLRKINDQMSSLAVMEVLSPALRLFDIRTVYAFAQSMNAKLASRGFTSFVLMERDAHDPMVNAAMEELFDGIIDIRISGGSLELGILSIRGCHFQPEYRLLTKMRDRLNIDVSRRIQDSEIVDTITSHGMPARLKNLERELDETLAEKRELERRLKEFAEKEAQFDQRHQEMKVTLQQVEERLKIQSEQPPIEPGMEPGHREEMARLLKVMDGILENLPQDVINSFARSEDFKLYEKILKIYLEDKE